MNDNPQQESATLECGPAKDPAVRWFIFAAMMIAMALWCWSDRRDPPEAWDAEHINQIGAYLLNNWGPVVFAPVGLIAVFAAVGHLRRTLVADESGITYGSEKMVWKEVTRLDATKLKSKGILTVIHGDGQTLKLDSWKLQNFQELVAFVEKKLPDVETIQPQG